MGAADKFIQQWIDDIPNSKLEGGLRTSGQVHSDIDARLDAQGLVRKPDGSYSINLQLQLNRGIRISTLKKFAPVSFAWCEVPENGGGTAAMIKQNLRASVTGRALPRPGRGFR